MLQYYRAAVTVPHSWHKPADITLASILVGGGISMEYIQMINPWLALVGGVFGLIIGAIRVYEVLKPYFTKDK